MVGKLQGKVQSWGNQVSKRTTINEEILSHL